MKTERVTVASLLFDPANVRKHGERNLDSIKASLARFGQQKPIVVDGDGIVRAGNGTLMAAKALGWEEIEIVRTNLRGSEATAYAIADNRTAELAEWDEAALAEQLAALQIDDETLAAATGFDASEIERMALPVDVVEDEVPEVPVEPITKPGDLWLLGEHRVLCGDSTKEEDVARLMGDETPDCIATDPPYGISHPTDYKKRGRGQLAECRDYLPVVGDDAPYNPTEILKWNKPTILRGGNHFASKLPDSGGWLVWDKERPDDLDQATCELAWTNCVKGVRRIRHLWNGMIRLGDDDLFHPTQKPVAVILWSLSLKWIPKGSVYDPFLGSGTTLIAAEQLGRKCYGMEISPAYCDVIVKRWETMTGKKATLAA